MKTESPNCAPRSTAPPAASCSIRNSSTRSSTRSCAARPRWNRAPLRSARFPMPRSPVRSGRQPAARPRTTPASGTPKPSPISDTVIFVAPPDREARLESRAPIVKPQPNQFAKVQGFDNVLVRLQTSLDPVERRQMAALTAVEDSMESRVRRMRGVFSDLGLDMAQLEAATPRSAIGGPFVPVKLSADAGAFERQLYRINITRAQMERLNRDAGAGALSQACDRRSRIHIGLRSPQRSLPRPAGDAYRPRFPRGRRRSRPRHRERQGAVIGMDGRLWPHGGDRPRQRPVDPLWPSL